MAVPILAKTWQFQPNIIVPYTDGLCAKDTCLAIKNAMKAFSSSPWTVWGSCNSIAFGNGDNVDRWATRSDVVWGAGARSWIVLQQPGLEAKTSFLINLASSNPNYASFQLSPAAGFGVVNGGTDGTTTAAPTASDAVSLSWDSLAGWSNYSARHIVHAMQSTDGQCTRIVIARQGNATAIWLIDKAKNPVAHWITPIVGCVYGTYSNSLTRANLSNASNAPFRSKINGVSVSGVVTYEACVTYAIQDQQYPDDVTGEWAFGPMGLFFPTGAGARGRKGELPDIWWGNTYRMNGDMYPPDGLKEFTTFRDVILPWDGSSAPLFT